MYGGNLYYTLGSELSGGLYYGLGLGVSAPSYELELLYSVNMGKMEGFYYNGYSLYNYIYDVEYRKVTILLGYKL
ncbi:MAG: hypothetical protein A3J83_01905 [Elusimicrobia bacterium RIFOXYA2_FULL_40_6]|nr:MAG: hypothetical protein A3J83_01905 [Elusimicrobia bacterium RIFOXYA2_FULL_40_6]